MRTVRQSVEMQAGLDAELTKRCGYLIHIQAFDEAVRNAFVLLEERLRRLLDPNKSFGVQMIEASFKENGYFAKQLGDSKQEREGLEHLLLGAFKLYRNPTAHTAVGYSVGESRSIIYLIDLILKKLDQVAAIPTQEVIPDNIQQVIVELEKATTPIVGKRARIFVSKYLKEGLQPRFSSKQWLSFRKYTWVKLDHWETAKVHPITVFYLLSLENEQGIWMPINQYYRNVVGFKSEQTIEHLKILNFQTSGKFQDYYLNLQKHNTQAFFDDLFKEIKQITDQFNSILKSNTV